MSNTPHKPRFEPPPWEREAFDRFQQQRIQQRAPEDPEDAGAPTGDPHGAESTQGSPVPLGLIVPEVKPVAAQANEKPAAQPIPEARIDSMLIQLRSEEPRAASANMTLVNTVSALLAVLGLVVIVQSALLFARVRASEAATVLLAGTMSFVVFLSGLGLLAVAWMLFRKYHR